MRTLTALLLLILSANTALCQDSTAVKDTLLARQKAMSALDTSNVMQNRPSYTRKNPFMPYTGKTIRSIRIRSLGFESDINDTTILKGGLGVALGNSLHRTTRKTVLENNLLFEIGDKVNPYLFADNERFLRDQLYLQDAIIMIRNAKDDPGAVDVTVIAKDVFSFGPGFSAGGTKKYRFDLKDENVGGTGSRVLGSIFFDGERKPKTGFGAEYFQRNVKGSFINWGVGFKTFNNTFNTTNNAENYYYLKIEKPFVSQYLRWLGSLDVSYNKTNDYYAKDTLYFSDHKYGYYLIDGWAAYVFGKRKLMYANLTSKARKFIAVRAFSQHFMDIPNKANIDYDGSYSGNTGILASFSIFQQNYYRTTYIYGFGRNEDVPVGYSASLIGGYSMRKDSFYNRTRTRSYYGIEGQRGKFNDKGFYSGYALRFGGNNYHGKWEDVDLLLSVDHFTRLRQVNSRWYQRYFFSGSFTKQFSPVLEQALLLRSPYGLNYFEYGYINADMRATAKTEIAFYHTKRYFGFGFAPFAFADGILLKPTHLPLGKSDFYSGVGTGFRIRNENLIFGTIEARFSYFPRILPNMNHFKIKFNTNLRYKFNNSFIRKPDFVSPNTL